MRKLSIAVLLASAVCAAAAAETDRTTFRGREFEIRVAGSGSPSVVLISGLGESSLAPWEALQDEVATFATVLAYTPLGTGADEGDPEPRDSVAVAKELRGLLDHLELAPPYVLVGHSYGGFHARVFATLYREQVSGLVLVDASHEQFFRRLDELEEGAFEAALGRMDRRNEKRSPLARRDFAAFRRVIARGELPRGGLAPELPRVVLTSAQRVAEPRGLIETPPAVDLWVELHRQWVEGASHATHVVTEDSGHYIQAEQPELVAEAIRGLATGSVDQEVGEDENDEEEHGAPDQAAVVGMLGLGDRISP